MTTGMSQMAEEKPPFMVPQGSSRLLLLSFLGWKGKGREMGEQGREEKGNVNTGLCDVPETE